MGQTDATDLPPGVPLGVALAWGLAEPSVKGPKRGLSTRRIVRTAIECAAAEGLAAVSMSRVAATLGVSTMALYRYVSAKSDLLTLMGDEATGPPPSGLGEAADWRTGLAEWAAAQRTVLYRHLWVLALPISSPPATPNAVAWTECGLRALRGTALEPGEKLGALTSVMYHVRGDAKIASEMADAARAAGSTPEQAAASYAELMGRLTDPERFPELTEVLRSGVLGEDSGADADFAYGLELVLDGVAAMVDRAAARVGALSGAGESGGGPPGGAR